MEIDLIQREIPVWQAERLPRRRTTLSAESVIPDTQQDVKYILSVRGDLLLKGKDLSPQGVSVSGEARATVLYLAEDGVSLGTLRLSKPFTLDFETPDPDENALPRLSWRLSGLEARILNPRKLAADFAVTADLEVYRRGTLCLSRELPEGDWPGLHLQRAEKTELALTGVCEKSFSLREQFSFPAGKPVPAQIAGEEICFRVLGCEQVGDRAIVKGEMRLSVWGLSEAGDPVRCCFSSSFSQLMEPGGAAMDRYRVRIEPSSAWFDFTEAIGGERMLDAEIHAVAQLCVWTREPVQAVTDAYSTRMPCACTREARSLLCAQELQNARLSAEERLPMPEDCGDLLAVLPHLGPPERDGGSLPMSLELLYRTRDGAPAAAKRSLELKGGALPEGAVAGDALLLSLDVRPAGDTLEVRAEAELPWERQARETLDCLTGLELREDRAADPNTLPALTLVRPAGESLWELGKAYHSSEELIEGCNPTGAELLLIPTERA